LVGELDADPAAFGRTDAAADRSIQFPEQIFDGRSQIDLVPEK
jgi:hypothetical protein